MTEQLHIFSFGGGVQSTAALVLAAQNKLPITTFVFSNVGNDSENPDTLDYLNEYSKPFAEQHGLTLAETAWIGSVGPLKGKQRTLYTDLLRSETSVPIPMRLTGGGFGNRLCTLRYKIEPIERYLRGLGATPDNKALLSLGISFDEIHRAKSSKSETTINHYPILNITRQQCEQIIIEAGLPVPPKSSCWFCPFKGIKDWQEQNEQHPDLTLKAAALEEHLNAIRAGLGKDRAYFAPGERPLLDAIKQDHKQLSLFDGCDSGNCWT